MVLLPLKVSTERVYNEGEHTVLFSQEKPSLQLRSSEKGQQHLIYSQGHPSLDKISMVEKRANNYLALLSFSCMALICSAFMISYYSICKMGVYFTGLAQLNETDSTNRLA